MIRRLLAIAALAVLGTASAVASSAVTAEEGPGVSVELSQYSPSVLLSTDQLRVTANVTNPTALGIVGLEVQLKVTNSPLATSAAVNSFLEDPTSVSTRVAATKPVTGTSVSMGGVANVLPPGATAPVAIAAGPEALGLPVDTSGVYGVSVAVAGSSGELAQRAAVVTWYDAEITRLPLAFVATATGSSERVAQVLSAAAVEGTTVVVDPIKITDSLQAASLVGGHEVFTVPSGNPDLTSIAHGEDRTLLDFAVMDARENSQTPLTGLPTLATILVPDAQTISIAADIGATGGLLEASGGTTIVGSAPVVDVAAGDVSLPVIVPNQRLSELLATYRPGMPDAAARLVAEAALIAGSGDGETPVVVAPGTAWEVPGMGASRPASDLLNAPWVVPTTIDAVLTGSARGSLTARNTVGTAADLSPDLIQALTLQLENLDQLSRTAEDPNVVLLPGGRTLLEPLASSLRSDHERRSNTYQASRDAVQATLQGLHVASGSDVNLIAASGRVPVTLQNDLDVDATVSVVMRSTSPNLVVQDTPVVTIPAGSSVTAFVSVTGVKSANVSASIALQNTDGDIVASPQVMTVRVRADWGTAITAVFTVGLVLLLIAGLVRTIRRGRRSSRMAPMEPEKPERGEDG